MSVSVHALLEQIIRDEVSLNKNQVSQASVSHTYARGLLGNKNTTDPSFPHLLGEGLLSGSYSRGTKIRPLDDVDVMLVMDGSGLFVIKNGYANNEHVVKGNNTPQNPILKHLDSNSLLDSRKIIDLFQKSLRDSYPSSTIKKDGQAVNIFLTSSGIGIDIVPCFHIKTPDHELDHYYIPSGNNNSGWTSTNPEIDLEISKKFVEALGDNFKNFVRLVKYWNVKKNNSRIKSYHLETVIWHTMMRYGKIIDDYEDALRYFFLNCSPFLEKRCVDLTEIGEYVDGYLSWDDRSASLQRVDEVKAQIRSADVQNFAGNSNAHINQWKKLFE